MSDKKTALEKKRADLLDMENKSLQSKLKLYEDSNSKLVQRQQQIASLRKQLKTREDEMVVIKDQLDSAHKDVDNWKRKLSASETKILQLEATVQQMTNRLSGQVRIVFLFYILLALFSSLFLQSLIDESFSFL